MRGAKNKILKLRVEESLIEELDTLGSEFQETRSEVVRELLEEGVEIHQAIGECVGKDRERLKRLLRQLLTHAFTYELLLTRYGCHINAPDYWEWCSWVLEKASEKKAAEVAAQLLREYGSGTSAARKARIREVLEGTSYGRHVVRSLREGTVSSEGWPTADMVSEWTVDEKTKDE